MPDVPNTASEHYHQVHLVAWFRRNFPDQTILAIPNGGHRHKGTAMKLKAEGVLPGVLDLLWLDQYCWIEMKTPSGRLSNAQKDFIVKAEAAGYGVIVGYGAEDAAKKILKKV